MPVKGMDQLRQRFEALRLAAPKVMDTAVYALGLRIIGKAAEGTPIRYGFLRRSAYCSPAATTGGVVRVGYGMVYARRLHFGSQSWNWTEPGTGPLFLQNAWDAEISRGREFLVLWCEEWLARMGGAAVPPRPSSSFPVTPPDLNAEAKAYYARVRAALRKGRK